MLEPPGVLLPESNQSGVGAAENIAFGLANVGHASGMGRAREIALTVTGVLPKLPASPWRRVTRCKMVVRDP